MKSDPSAQNDIGHSWLFGCGAGAVKPVWMQQGRDSGNYYGPDASEDQKYDSVL